MLNIHINPNEILLLCTINIHLGLPLYLSFFLFLLSFCISNLLLEIILFLLEDHLFGLLLV